MAVPYEKIVAEDLNRGHGSVLVTMPGGGSATGSNIGIHTLLDDQFNVADFGAVGDGVTNDSDALAAAVAALPATGGVLHFDPHRTYRTTQIFSIERSNVILEGHNAEILFQPIDPVTHDRILRIHAGDPDGFSAARAVTGSISIGDSAFVSADVTDVVAGDWLCVQEIDTGVNPAEIVIFDWVQVESVSGSTVSLYHPFRTAFPGTHGEVTYFRVSNVVENVVVRDLGVRTTTASNNLPGVVIGICRNVTLENVSSAPARGNGFTSYRSQGLTLLNCKQKRNNGQATEFAASVDLRLLGNLFGSFGAAADKSALVLDYGTAFFAVVGNSIVSGVNIGVQITYGCHDGVFADNIVSFVNDLAAGFTYGVTALGSQRVVFAGNILTGGDPGGAGIGLSAQSDTNPVIASQDNVIGFNIVKNFATPYDTQNTTNAYLIPYSGWFRSPNGLVLGEDAAALDTLLYLKLTDTTKLAIRWGVVGVANYYTGVENAGGAIGIRYWFGFNGLSQRDVWIDQDGHLVLNNGLSAGGLQVGSAGQVMRAVYMATASKAAGDYSANPIGANSVATFSMSVPGATQGHIATVSPDATPGDGLVWSARVSATDTVVVHVANVTGAPVTPNTVTWMAMSVRKGT